MIDCGTQRRRVQVLRVPAQYRSIQAAVDAACDGDAILVSGEFEERVHVSTGCVAPDVSTRYVNLYANRFARMWTSQDASKKMVHTVVLCGEAPAVRCSSLTEAR